MQTTELQIEGMTCLNCATHIEKALEAVPGVQEVTVDMDSGATVRHEGADEEQLVRAVKAAGDYRAHVRSERKF